MNDAAKDFDMIGDWNNAVALIGRAENRAITKLLKLSDNTVITYKRIHDLAGLILSAAFDHQQVTVVDSESGHRIAFKTNEEGESWSAN